MSLKPVRRVTLRGTVERRSEADDLVTQPGDVVVVERDRLRSVVIACPDGCGERLTVNLDPTLGPAWRLYRGRRGLTLFPSVWRESGCGSHFIVWGDTVLWCDRWEEDNRDPEPDGDQALFANRVLQRFGSSLRPYAAVAEELGEIPWEVLRASRRLAIAGHIEEGRGKQVGWFRRTAL